MHCCVSVHSPCISMSQSPSRLGSPRSSRFCPSRHSLVCRYPYPHRLSPSYIISCLTSMEVHPYYLHVVPVRVACSWGRGLVRKCPAASFPYICYISLTIGHVQPIRRLITNPVTLTFAQKDAWCTNSLPSLCF